MPLRSDDCTFVVRSFEERKYERASDNGIVLNIIVMYNKIRQIELHMLDSER